MHAFRYYIGGRRGRNHMVVESVLITAKVLSSNPTHGEVYSIQHYVIKFVGVVFSGFLHHKPKRHDITEIL